MHRPINQLTLAQLRSKSAGRNLYVWGAGNQGRGIAKVLSSNKFDIEGFIDSSTDLIGNKLSEGAVYSPDILKKVNSIQPFIIISVFFHSQAIHDACINLGLKEDIDFIHYWSLKPRDYSIDVSGHCNLRCIACPRGTGLHTATGGMMSLTNFRKVIDKIKVEDPFVGNVQLYQWGEPSLNKDLPSMISYAREQGINCAISSNLNSKNDFTNIIKSKPEWLRVSASGWKSDYETTHTGGNWQTFLDNFKKISYLRSQYHPQMKIELFYHIYKHSTGDGFLFWENLCKKLQVEFHPVYAYLISLDDVLNYLEGYPLPATTEKARQCMLLSLSEGLSIAKEEIGLECDTIRSIHINPDLSVSNCMMYYYPEQNRAVKNFLEHSIEEIMRVRLSCNLCKRCMKHAMHRYCGAYSTFIPELNTLRKDA